MAEIYPANTADDLATTRGLFEQYARSLGFDLGFQDFAAEVENLPGDYAPPHGCILLAKHDDRIVGCVALRKLEGTTCEMKRLYVMPDARGKGSGRNLAEAVILRAKKMGYKQMRLCVWIPSLRSNPPIIFTRHWAFGRSSLIAIIHWKARSFTSCRCRILILELC
jgi:GNAT superfamily N-acetyltransferase